VAWTDEGSGAEWDVKITKTPFDKKLFNPDFCFVPGHKTSMYLWKVEYGSIVCTLNKKLTTPPIYYEWAYDDRGSGAHTDVMLLHTRCPYKFYPMGDIAVTGGRRSWWHPGARFPSKDSRLLGVDRNHRCIAAEACVNDDLLSAPFDMMWRDKGSGGTYDANMALAGEMSQNYDGKSSRSTNGWYFSSYTYNYGTRFCKKINYHYESKS